NDSGVEGEGVSRIARSLSRSCGRCRRLTRRGLPLDGPRHDGFCAARRLTVSGRGEGVVDFAQVFGTQADLDGQQIVIEMFHFRAPESAQSKASGHHWLGFK